MNREITVHHISSLEANWTRKYADLLENAQDGDIIVVNRDAMVELGENALKRRTQYKWLRIMTEKIYTEIEGNP